jgi:hypothetical protein
LLPVRDQAQYFNLKGKFSAPNYWYRRYRSLDIFEAALGDIRAFVHQDGADNIARPLVSGFYAMDSGVAINIQQFRHLFPKSRSVINLMLQQLHYEPLPSRADVVLDFWNMFALIRDNGPLKRQWSVRRRPPDSQSREPLENFEELQLPPPFAIFTSPGVPPGGKLQQQCQSPRDDCGCCFRYCKHSFGSIETVILREIEIFESVLNFISQSESDSISEARSIKHSEFTILPSLPPKLHRQSINTPF